MKIEKEIKKLLNIITGKYYPDPYKQCKKYKNIDISEDTILLSSCNFEFRGVEKNNLIKIGKNSMIGCSFIFETDKGNISIGDNTYVGSSTKLISREKIYIGNHVTIAWDCVIYDHNSHSLDYKERQKDIFRQNNDYRNGDNFIKSKDWSVVKSKPIIIEDNVWIGFDCVILSGVRIGEGAIVGAKSVVRKDVKPWTVVVGNPAVEIKKLTNE